MTLTVPTGDAEVELQLAPLDAEKGLYEVHDNDPANNGILQVQLNAQGGWDIVHLDPAWEEARERIQSTLDEIAEQQFAQAQSGIEYEEEEAAAPPADPYDPDKIRVEGKNFALRHINDKIHDGDIALSPEFQRFEVWDLKRKSLLIESILLRIPLPVFYFAEDEHGKLNVVDGLQRLSTVHQFMQNKFKLKHLEYLTDCEGCFYNHADKPSLNDKYRRRINDTQIVANVIDPASPAAVKYDIFRRINTGGRPLNHQEIRNCLAAEPVRQLLRRMVERESFRRATLGSIKPNRMEDQEMALRFIGFYRFYRPGMEISGEQHYSGNMKVFLDELVELLGKPQEQARYEAYEAAWDRAMQNAEHLFGPYAFRKCLEKDLEPGARQQLINKVLFTTWAVVLSRYEPEAIRAANEEQVLARPQARRIDHDADLFNKLTYSTNAKANIERTFAITEELLAGYVKTEGAAIHR
jgi:hypothetical protein